MSRAWEPLCGAPPRTVAWRRSVNQWWPVTDRPVLYGPHVIGGQFKAFGTEPAAAPAQPTGMTTGQLATTMVLRGAVGTLIGAAAAPTGREGIWGAAGFVMGATFGELGIVGVALAALWRKAG